MTGATSRRTSSRVTAVFLAALVSIASVVLAGPATARQTDEPPPATIALAARSAWVGEGRTVTLDVVTEGDTAGTTIRVRIHPPMDSVEDLETSLTDDVGGITRSIDLGPTDDIAVQDDGTRRIELTADDIRLPGVHPVVVELRSGDGGVLGVVRTPVVRLGSEDDALDAPLLSLVVDVAVPPTLEPDGRRDLRTSELDRLGRLVTFLDVLGELEAPPPVTLLVRADTVDALGASTDRRAGVLLEALSTAARAPEVTVVALPYVPVSAGALADAGLGEVVGTAVATGTTVLTDRLGVDPSVGVWSDDDVTPDAGPLLAGLGIRTVLTASTAAPPTDDVDDGRLLVPAGPRVATSLGETEISALVTDEETAESLTAPAGERIDDPQIEIADLVLRDDGRSSTVVVRLDDVPEGALLPTLVPLLTADDSPVPIGELPVAGSTTRDPDREDPLAPVDLPAGTGDDLGDVADQYRTVVGRIGTFEAFDAFDLVESSEVAPAVTLRLRALTAVAEGVADDRRSELLDTVDRSVTTAFDAVSLTGQTDLNLTSRTGSLPIAIQNDNDHPVRILVRIGSDRLRFPDGEEFELVAEPDITRFDIPVEALATGSVPTFVEILTPDGGVMLDDRQLNVRSTAVSGVGLALSLGALAVLAIWWIRTWRRGRITPTPGASRTPEQ